MSIAIALSTSGNKKELYSAVGSCAQFISDYLFLLDSEKIDDLSSRHICRYVHADKDLEEKKGPLAPMKEKL